MDTLYPSSADCTSSEISENTSGCVVLSGKIRSNVKSHFFCSELEPPVALASGGPVTMRPRPSEPGWIWNSWYGFAFATAKTHTSQHETERHHGKAERGGRVSSQSGRILT